MLKSPITLLRRNKKYMCIYVHISYIYTHIHLNIWDRPVNIHVGTYTSVSTGLYTRVFWYRSENGVKTWVYFEENIGNAHFFQNVFSVDHLTCIYLVHCFLTKTDLCFHFLFHKLLEVPAAIPFWIVIWVILSKSLTNALGVLLNSR